MEFNATTFILEIINFLILIWILQRLFYQPLLTIIAKRKQHIDQSLADAQKLHQEAEELRSLYENRQKLWEHDKQAAFTALHQQIESERSAQMDKLFTELEQERQKAEVTLTRQQQKFQQQAEQQALFNGARFAGILLQKCTGPDLEERLFALLIESLAALPESSRIRLQMLEHQKKALRITIVSAYPLASERRQHLEETLGALISGPINCQYQQDASLIAGVRIDIGAWVFHANVKHELAGFAELAYESL